MKTSKTNNGTWAVVVNGIVRQVEPTEADAYVWLWESGLHLLYTTAVCYYS